MAVMLRSVGIPSRIVNGFSGGEFNDLTSQYVIRASDAHSWVEAYIPGEGWMEFDPTPSSGSGANSQWSRYMLYMDAMSSFWREWVVNYDLGHQIQLHPGRQPRQPRHHWTSAVLGTQSVPANARLGQQDRRPDRRFDGEMGMCALWPSSLLDSSSPAFRGCLR